jgi:hypothetical protein
MPGVVKNPGAILATGYALNTTAFVFSLPIALCACFASPVEAFSYADNMYLTGKQGEPSEIDLDYDRLATALQKDENLEELFKGDVYRPNFDSYEALNNVNGDIRIYKNNPEDEEIYTIISDLEEEILSLGDPIFFEKETKNGLDGKLIVPTYFEDPIPDLDGMDLDIDEELYENVYSSNPAIVIDYSPSEGKNLPAARRSYEEVSETELETILEDSKA